MNMIVADADSFYTGLLAARLQLRWPSMKIYQCCDQQSLQRLIAKFRQNGERTLFLYHAMDFQELSHLATKEVWPKNWHIHPLLSDHFLDPASDGTALSSGFNRYDPVSKLIAGLEDQYGRLGDDPADLAVLERQSETDQYKVPFHPAAVKAENLVQQETERTVCSAVDSKTVPQRLWLMVSICPAGYHAKRVKQRLRLFVQEGRQVVYLPLMPTYLMSCLVAPGQGPSLSDLLLHIIGQSVSSDQLGQYWQAHPDGYLQFRPPDRADDLVLCPPDTLRQLVRLLKEHLERQVNPMVALIDCAGLALSAIAAVAVLCDTCEIDLPKDQDYASEAARMEIGHLLASLPPGCEIKEQIL